MKLGRSILCATLFLVGGNAKSGQYVNMQKRIASAKSSNDVIRIVESDPKVARNREFHQDLLDAINGDYDRNEIADRLRTKVELAAMAERRNSPTIDRAQAEEIKKSPIYADSGTNRRSNWLADALERLKNIRWPKQQPQDFGGGPGLAFLGDALTILMWTAITIGVALFLFYGVRLIRFKRSLTKKTKALMAEDEPERSRDEWLVLADEHAAAGRYREAIRALYLACLLAFDERNVARFDRSETNWEHLTRIQSSPLLPQDLDFLPPTKLFDRVWYGYQTNGQADVAVFRDWYQQIVGELRGAE